VVAIVQEGRVILARGYGQENLSEPSPIDPAVSTFRVGSVAKLFTWTAVMQLVEQGKLDLDEDVNTYLKGMQLPRTYDAPVTLRSLMTHTAGFEEGSLFYLTALDPKQQSSIQATLVRHMAVRVRPPLTMPAYSNYGAALAGLIVEQVSGVPFNDYVRRNIFEPLRMSHTTAEEPLPEAMRAHEVSGYTYSNGSYVRQPFEVIGGWRPAGSASSSAIDMTRFMLAHLQQGEHEGGRILQPGTTELMHTVAFRMDDRIAGMALGFYERSVNGLRIVGHAGDTDFFHTDLILIPERRFGLLISYVGGGDSTIRKGLLKVLANRYFPAPATPPPASSSSDFARGLERYAGSYQPSRRNISDIYKVFNLATQIDVEIDTASRRLLVGSGDGVQQFAPVGADLFQQVGGDRRIAFRVDDNARATHLFFDGTPYNGMERTPWHERPATFLLAVILCVVTFIVALIKLRPRVLTYDSRVSRWVLRIATGTAMLALLIVSALVALIMNADEMFYGVPLALKLVLLLPPVFAVITIALIAATMLSWSRGYWTRSHRFLYTVNCIAAVVLCVLFYQWNVFGWQFG
jgi:CubicO group peptidase (beta-lactamase class C family)